MYYYEDDLFELTEEEFCKKYGIDKWEYELLHKEYQEM